MPLSNYEINGILKVITMFTNFLLTVINIVFYCMLLFPTLISKIYIPLRIKSKRVSLQFLFNISLPVELKESLVKLIMGIIKFYQC